MKLLRWIAALAAAALMSGAARAETVTVFAAASLKNAHLLSQRVEVGMLWINQPATPSAELPFGGIKDSGYGSEGGPEALDAYLNTRSVAILNS